MNTNNIPAITIVLNNSVMRDTSQELAEPLRELAFALQDEKALHAIADVVAGKTKQESVIMANWKVVVEEETTSIVIDEKVVKAVIKLTARYYKICASLASLWQAAKGLIDLRSLKEASNEIEAVIKEKVPAKKPAPKTKPVKPAKATTAN